MAKTAKEKQYDKVTKQIETLEEKISNLDRSSERNYKLAVNKLRREYGVKNITGDLNTVMNKFKSQQKRLLTELSSPYVKRGAVKALENVAFGGGVPYDNQSTPLFSQEGGIDYKLNPNYIEKYSQTGRTQLMAQQAKEAAAIEEGADQWGEDGIPGGPFPKPEPESTLDPWEQTAIQQKLYTDQASKDSLKIGNVVESETVYGSDWKNPSTVLQIKPSAQELSDSLGSGSKDFAKQDIESKVFNDQAPGTVESGIGYNKGKWSQNKDGTYKLTKPTQIQQQLLKAGFTQDQLVNMMIKTQKNAMEQGRLNADGTRRGLLGIFGGG